MPSGRTFIEMFYHCCDLERKHSNPVFFLLKTVRLMMMYHQTKVSPERISSSEETVQTVIFWLYEFSLRPWPWRLSTNLFHMIHPLMIIMHHHSKFGHKRLGDSVRKQTSPDRTRTHYRPWSTLGLNLTMRSVATGNRWNGSMGVLRCHWSAPLVSLSNWSDCRTSPKVDRDLNRRRSDFNTTTIPPSPPPPSPTHQPTQLRWDGGGGGHNS